MMAEQNTIFTENIPDAENTTQIPQGQEPQQTSNPYMSQQGNMGDFFIPRPVEPVNSGEASAAPKAANIFDPQTPQPTSGRQGVSLAAMVVGIISFLIGGWVPVLGFLVGWVAIALGIASINDNMSGRSYAIAGMVMGAFGLIISIIGLFVSTIARLLP